MSDLLAISIGCLVSASIYLILSHHLMRIIFGIMLLGNAINLAILLLGRINDLDPAFSYYGNSVSNSLAQALILTSIVISFGLCLFCFVLAKKAWKRYRTLNIQASQWQKE